MTKELSFTESESTAIISGLGAALVGTWVLIKNYAIKVIKKRNDNIEQRLSALEKSQISLMNKIREVNHKIDNNDKGSAGAFQEILERLDEMQKAETGLAFEVCKIIDKKKK